MKNITKKLAVTLTLATMAVTLAGAVGVTALTYNGAGTDKREVADAVSETANTDRVYTVSSIEGVIGVYYSGELVFQSDIAVSALPTSDQEALSEGIVVANYEQVLALLEDYSS